MIKVKKGSLLAWKMTLFYLSCRGKYFEVDVCTVCVVQSAGQTWNTILMRKYNNVAATIDFVKHTNTYFIIGLFSLVFLIYLHLH